VQCGMYAAPCLTVHLGGPRRKHRCVETSPRMCSNAADSVTCGHPVMPLIEGASIWAT
jgi:hypothetical protein